VSFTLNNQHIEIVEEFKYLGVLFSKNGSFLNTKKHFATQATRAMFSLIKNANRLDLPIDLQIDLFNKTIKPILLFGVEVWGFGNIQLLERVQLRFLKHIFKMNNSTPNYMVYGESGCHPLWVDIEERMINFWSSICTTNNLTNCKLSCIIYQHLRVITRNLSDNLLQKRFPWVYCIKNVLLKTGLINIWETHVFPNTKWLKLTVKQKLKDLSINEWFSNVETSSKGQTYRIFKHNFQTERYLANTPKQYIYHMLKFRTRNHRFPIETGSWARVPVNQRFCTTCEGQLGDEFHYLFQCRIFEHDRNLYLKPYYYRRPNIFKFDQLLNTNNQKEYNNLCKFVKIIINYRF
jgi:hypothetical protein